MRRKNENNTLKFGVSATMAAPKKTIPAVEDEMWKTIFEEYHYEGSDIENFIRLLEKKETFTCRALVSSNKLTFSPITEKQYNLMLQNGIPEEVIKDAMEYTGLCVKIGRHTYPVGVTAMPNFWRIAIANRDNVAKTVIANFFNAAVANKTTQKGNTSEYLALAYGGKIDGFFSSIYTPFPAYNYMRHSYNAIRKAYGEIECIRTSFDHSYYVAQFLLKGEEAANLEMFFKQQIVARLERQGVKANVKDINLNLGLTVKTGENGNETATIRSTLSINKTMGLYAGEDVVLYHKGEKDIEEDIPKKIGNIFISYQDTIDRLIAAADIVVMDWRSTIINLADVAKIPEDVWKALIVEFENEHKSANVVTGYDIFSAFVDSVDIYRAKFPQATENMLEAYNIKIKKVLKENIQDYDNDENKIKDELSKQYLTYPATVLFEACNELGIPVAIRKRLSVDLDSKTQLYAMSHAGEDMPITAFDIYTMILNSSVHMREWYKRKNLDTNTLEEKMVKYQKSLANAKKVCYVAFDKEAV